MNRDITLSGTIGNMDRKATKICPTCEVAYIRQSRARCRQCAVDANKPPVDPMLYLVDDQPCRKIPLTQGQYALVNEWRYEELMKANWSAHWAPNTKSFYAVRRVAAGVHLQRTVSMHGLIKPKSDHRNGVSLDNRDSNLRAASASQQGCNRGKRSDNGSGFVGVSPRGSRFIARVTLDGKTVRLPGSFATASAAATARDLKAIELHGEFARLNQVST